MSQLPIDEALNRFKDNESRLDKFINDGTGYTSSAGASVESLPAFLARQEQEIEETTGTVAANLTASNAAKIAAEAARDAAIIQAGVYVDEPTGRAAVANGVAFKVQGSGDVAAYEYRRVNASSSTLIATYPSVAAMAKAKNTADLAKNEAGVLGGTFKDWALNPITGKYIAKATGNETTTAGWNCTDFIEVRPSSRITRDGAIIGGISAAAAIAFYDESKSFLGYYVDLADAFNILISDVFATAKYVRFSIQVGFATSIYVIESGIVEFINDQIYPIIGKPINKAVGITTGNKYIAKADGTLTTLASTWGATDFVEVEADSIVIRDAPIIPQSSPAAAIAFYDASQVFLGYYNNKDPKERIRIGDKFPTAAYIRVSFANTSAAYALYIQRLNSTESLNLIQSGVVADFLADNPIPAYVNTAGALIYAANWQTTDFVPCQYGQRFLFSNNAGGAGSGSVSFISLYDSVGNFLESLATSPSSVDRQYKVTNINAKFVRASAAITGSYKFVGARIPLRKTLSVFAPNQAYALQGEALYMYARGIIAERSIEIAWNVSQASEEVCKIVPASTTAIPVKLRAYRDSAFPEVVASFNVLVTGTPVNPVAPRNVICIGDSLTDGNSVSGIDGAYVNELSRRLTGTGTALLTGAQSPAAKALSNFKFRGTLGDQVVKHEGRGGWKAANYLNNASVGGVLNAFWNAGTSQFDLDYYLTTNGFDSGSDPTGVAADGSNLTVVILLGWNDVYNSTVSSSTTNLADLVDKIKTAKPLADVIVLGLNPAPITNLKAWSSGERFVSEREVFEAAVKVFGEAYKAMCASKTGVDFLQISHVFNPEIGYNFTTREVSLRSATTQSGCSDHVHPNAVGYAMIADAVFYKLLYKYCR